MAQHIPDATGHTGSFGVFRMYEGVESDTLERDVCDVARISRPRACEPLTSRGEEGRGRRRKRETMKKEGEKKTSRIYELHLPLFLFPRCCFFFFNPRRVYTKRISDDGEAQKTLVVVTISVVDLFCGNPTPLHLFFHTFFLPLHSCGDQRVDFDGKGKLKRTRTH